VTDRTYQEQTQSITSDKTGRVIPRSALRRLVIKLDNALVESQVRVQGDFLYADSNSTGVATIKLNQTSEDPIPFLAQASVEGFPIRDAFISCAAQPGLILNLWYGYEARIKPPQATVAVTSNPVTVAGLPQGQDKDTSLGVVFSMFQADGAAVGINSAVQLMNPIGSGKRIYLDESGVYSNVANRQFQQKISSTALNGNGVNAPVNQLAGSGVASIAQVRFSNGVAPPAATAFDQDTNAVALVYQRRAQPTRPIILDPGQGFFYLNTTQNEGMSAVFKWREY